MIVIDDESVNSGDEPIDNDHNVQHFGESGSNDQSEDVQIYHDLQDEQSRTRPIPSADEERRVWTETCFLFGQSPDCASPSDPRHAHKVAGLRLPLRPHQLWAVGRCLLSKPLQGLMKNGLPGNTGREKTPTASLALWRHLPPPLPTAVPSASCPSGTYRLGFLCLCVPGGFAHASLSDETLLPGPGALFLVPAHPSLDVKPGLLRGPTRPAIAASQPSRCTGQPKTYFATLGLRPLVVWDDQLHVHKWHPLGTRTGTAHRDCLIHVSVKLVSGSNRLAPPNDAHIGQSPPARRRRRPAKASPRPTGALRSGSLPRRHHPSQGRSLLDTGLWQCVQTLIKRAGSPLFLLALSATPMSESPADLEPFLVMATEGSVAWAAGREH
ncbi:hypothetical protein SEUCBS140593_010515 [Sporothrix eucalyptigena]|uniref:SNF2 N-terminal domain-containing protein n=1 Tax=Sporothrix eucalyptigena TaxID=1812306 RepID=A0ABP0D4D4_9PEZI